MVNEDTIKINYEDLDVKEDLEESEEYDSNDTDDDNDDDGVWITPVNIKEMKKIINLDINEEDIKPVACMTSDFAIQNVLKQIGLNVASPNGKVCFSLGIKFWNENKNKKIHIFLFDLL